MLDGGNAGDKKWRKTSMGGEDGIRIIECLRGRLLAERLASKAAREDEEFMANKLIKLQVQLGKEIESRNEAERKLNFLMKLTDRRRSLEKTTSSSCSSTITIISQEPEEKSLTFNTEEHVKCCSDSEKEKMSGSCTSENVGNNCSEIRLLNPYLQTPAHGDSSTSVTSAAHSRNNSNDKLRKTEDKQKPGVNDQQPQASTSKKVSLTEENHQMKRETTLSFDIGFSPNTYFTCHTKLRSTSALV